jgi:hypothetical protein
MDTFSDSLVLFTICKTTLYHYQKTFKSTDMKVNIAICSMQLHKSIRHFHKKNMKIVEPSI